MCQCTEDRRLISVDMNDANLTLLEYSSEVSGSGQQGPVTIGQDDGFDSLPTRLGSQFAIVEEHEQGAHPLRREAAHDSEHMAFDTAEELTDRTYRDTLRTCGRGGLSRKIETVLAGSCFVMGYSISGGVRARWPYVALHGSHFILIHNKADNDIRLTLLPACFRLVYFMAAVLFLS